MHLDLAGDQEAAAREPVSLGFGTRQDMGVDVRGVLGPQAVGAVLEAEEVARRDLGRGRGRGAAESELRPADRRPSERDPGQVADGVHSHLRVVRAGLHHEVTVTGRRVEVVARKVGQAGERVGLAGGQAEPVGAGGVPEQGGAEAEGDGEVRRVEPDGLTGVVRRSVIGPGQGPDRAGAVPRGHAGRSRRPVLQELDEVIAGGTGQHVESSEVQPVLGCGGDAGLPGAVEVHRAPRGTGRLQRPAVGSHRTSPCEGDSGARASGSEEPAPRQPTPPRRGRGGHDRTAPAIFDSGSDRAFTASESSLTWALVSLS